MALTRGTKPGLYEILALIGAGGMGEVYRACEARLDRTVAVKTLIHRRSADQDLRLRFEREARLISGLSHPHIMTGSLISQKRERAGEATSLGTRYTCTPTLFGLHSSRTIGRRFGSRLSNKLS
jgi:serine/threonine protein kinase